MTIGEAADSVGVSAKAIRLWETRGLVPGIERTPAGYRIFDEKDLAILRFIRRAQALGMTLNEIGDVLSLQRGGTAPCAKVRQTLDARIGEIDRTIAQLQRRRDRLLAARGRADEVLDEEVDNPRLCRIIEQWPDSHRTSQHPDV